MDGLERPRSVIPRPFCTGELGMNKYSVTYPFVLQVIIIIIIIIITIFIQGAHFTKSDIQ